MKNLTSLRPAILALTAVVYLAAASTSTAQTAKRGGTVTMAIRKDLTVMNPLVRTFSTDKLIRQLMYESLLDLDEKGEIIPKLAESWEVSEGGQVYTFHLREGVRYHNGQEMTAADIKFAIDYTLNPKNGAYGRQRIIMVKQAEAVDKNTLRIHLKKPSASFLAVVTDIMAFSVIPQESIPEGVTKPGKYPPGTGPFKFVEWTPQQRIVFERFDGYWGKKAYLDRIVFRPISNDTVRFTALRSGDVDIVERTPYEWIRQIKLGEIRGIGISGASYAAYRALFFNVADPPFDNKKLRQAVAHAINKKELLNAAYFGFGNPINQKYPKGHVWHVEGLPSPRYDPAKARQLLKEAGYKGETIEMTIEQGKPVEAMASAIQAQLKRIGMNIKLNVVEYGTRRDQIRRGETTFDIVGSDFYADPVTTYRQELACEPNPKVRTGNWTGYCNRERDALFAKLDTEFDKDKRKELLKKILTMDAKAVAIVPIGFAPRFYTFREHVKNFATDGNGSFIWSGGGLHRTWVEQ